ncbi:hypothetical protein H6758_03570 [Candidatus Nomurabacteria bacterium]|nr:hypothetical protein [Candidatus Nomurabacteria bacterium]
MAVAAAANPVLSVGGPVSVLSAQMIICSWYHGAPLPGWCFLYCRHFEEFVNVLLEEFLSLRVETKNQCICTDFFCFGYASYDHPSSFSAK